MNQVGGLISIKPGSKNQIINCAKSEELPMKILLERKKSSKFIPDFCPIKLDDDPWIVQPTEHYEEIRINEIINKYKKG